jgi:hypothetical protein
VSDPQPDEDEEELPIVGPTGGAPLPTPPAVVEKVDVRQLPHFVSPLRSIEQQVGENIMQALHHDDTVAVLTTVVMGGDGVQRIVSAALDPHLMSEVQAILASAQAERQEEVPCIGFHCLLKKRPETA